MVKISVIIPAYNLESYIEKTLDTVMEQTVRPYEVIVVDDGSSDNTAELIAPYPVTLIRQENAGAATARNTGVERATGDWVAFLDGDDEWLPQKIEALSKKIEESPSCIMIAHNEFEGRANGPWLEKELSSCYLLHEPLFDQLFRRCFLSTSTMAVKRESFLKVGGMDSQLRSCQDYDLWLRLSLIGKLEFIEQTLSRYVLRADSITANALRRYYCLLLIISKHKTRVSRLRFLSRTLVVHYEAIAGARENGQLVTALKIASQLPWRMIKALV